MLAHASADCTGHQAIDYFNALPLAGEGMVLEALEEGNNEAEWIVDLTTQADRQGKCAFPLRPPGMPA